ncbi:hypothetical protein KDA_66270 [Dictyobacter alpinus]|uniref:DUF1963 domain-containing protein n=1 Tax=Dictyobacter alpinus TaxID=2014873 RepID=A0A402BID8_9CHLR|nr:YwqG family protein [Dictyobacter alpinus]GCE31143.1 hypothetical protein KDA_66270 [Dictyobacter alpinus]
MDLSATQSALQKEGLERLKQYTDVLLQPAIQLEATPVTDAGAEDKLEVGISKIGGVPDLPAAQQWPMWKDLPQSFVAQIRLADITSYDTNHWLPQQGMLWFFYDAKQETYGDDPQTSGGWQVLYSADIQHLERAVVPEKLPKEARFKTCAVKAKSELTMAQQPQLEIANLKWSDEDQEHYDTVYGQFNDDRDKTLPRHLMFGYPDTLQDDMRLQCQMASNGVTDINDPKVKDLSKDSNDWHLLLQVDSDDRTGMNWPGSGMLYYWIKLSDLKAQKFDHIWLVAQSA